jgi:hypothetical protein
VCSNCFRLIREERVDPTRSGLTRDLETTYQRRRETTEIGYGPGKAVSEHKGVWCACGVESHRHRIWAADDVGRERFRDFLKHVLETLARKEVSLRRRETAAYALQRFDDGAAVDEALATGIEAGIVAETAASDDRTQVA